MANNIYDNDYSTDKPEGDKPARRKVIVFGILILLVSAGWLLWREWQQRVQIDTLKLARNKVVNRIPPPAPKTADDSAYKRSSPKVESPKISQPHQTKEAAATDTTKDQMGSVAQGARSDSLQGAPFVTTREKNDSGTEAISLQQEDETEGKRAAEQSSKKPIREVYVIQVGAFRSLSAAANLRKELKQKGYDAYLDSTTLPNLGLMHRVRIRSYGSAAAAKADAERLKREEELDSIVIRLESD